MQKNIAVIHGDGIGKEIIEQACRILDKVATIYNHKFVFNELLAGGCAIDKYGECLPNKTLESCKRSDSILLGAVGGPKWDHLPSEERPESALLRLRKELGLFANIRPAMLLQELRESSPLKDSILDKGIDFIIVRELIGGIYFGEHKVEHINGEKIASDYMTYSTSQIESIAKVAFDIARNREKKIICVDKANVLSSSRLWREVVENVAKQYSDVELSFMYVDNAAMQICREPSQFDVILTENMFGDILSDEASVITGTIGIIPSASLSNSKDLANNFGMYEPIHGSAPDIANQNKANPIGAILSASMMLDISFNLKIESESIMRAVQKTLQAGLRTGDMLSPNTKLISCSEMGDRIYHNLHK